MLSEYEQVRLDNIARNDQFLQEIGLNVKSSGGSLRPVPVPACGREVLLLLVL